MQYRFCGLILASRGRETCPGFEIVEVHLVFRTPYACPLEVLDLKLILVSLLLLNVCFCNEDNVTIVSDSNSVNLKIPSLETSIGTGFPWVLQFTITVSPFQKLYIQPRFSVMPLGIEYGITAGYQTRMNSELFLRAGAGIAHFIEDGYFLYFKEKDDVDTLAPYFQIGFLNVSASKNVRHAFFSLIVGKDGVLPGINITWGFGFF